MVKQFLSTVFLMLSLDCFSQQTWTLEKCIQFGVENSHEVYQQSIEVENFKTDQMTSRAAFLPSINADVNAQFNFGRAIDPETNIYTDVNTFYNGYEVSTQIPIFDGFKRLNNLKVAKANLLMGRQGLLAKKDDIALDILKCFVDVVYYQKTLEMAIQKRSESQELLRQTQIMYEIGTKGDPDLAQMKATYSSDDYEVTRQEGLLKNALLNLKYKMNFPVSESLEIDSVFDSSMQITVDTIDVENNPKLIEAQLNVQSAESSLKSSKSYFWPSLYLGAGISSTFYNTLGANSANNFSDQIKNNAGEYVYATLSIPIFNRLSGLASVRKSKNNLRIAQDKLEMQRTELEKSVFDAMIERDNFLKECEKMRLKVDADSLSAQFIIRKYEEGLSSSIDVKTATVTLLQSKVQLLQCELTLYYEQKMLNYYNGQRLWTE